jgi:glycosyltransferase involved in cell wall biosynthesis
MRILLLEPYLTGSHRTWAEGYATHSQHQVHILGLPGRWWKWRMHGGAVTLARRFLVDRTRGAPDLILATDMLDLTTFLALTRARTAAATTALYFHENQLTYPPPPGEKRDLHYGFINYASALAADAVYFNSRFHMDDFFAELPRLLRHFPDHTELDTVAYLRQKARVLPLGMDLRRFDAHRPEKPRGGPPLIVWNHRWEHDKAPETFFDALYHLADKGVDFEVAIVGESFRQRPDEFERARDRLGARVMQFGYLARFADYAHLLWQADVQVSTARQDFFGASTCEALYCGCRPVLPRRLNYPRLIPQSHHDRCLYDEGELVSLLRQALTTQVGAPPALRQHVAQFDWSQMAPRYDETFVELWEAFRP